VRYTALFENAESRSELVAIFLALLELMKAKRIFVSGEGEEAEVQALSGAATNEEFVSDFD